MIKREDGRQTRLRLLNAACDVFAQKGYRQTKVADICKQAGANVAAVNYYFGDKASLYKEAWQHAIEAMDAAIASAPQTGTAEDHLREYIRALVHGFSEKGPTGRFSRLYLREMVSPTGLIQDAWHDLIEPKRRRLQELIHDIMGPQADRLTILLCEMSIINQCRALVTVQIKDLEYMLGQSLDRAFIARLAEHIADFSLAGIRSVGRQHHKGN